MTILELINNINTTLNKLTTDYEDLNQALKDKVDQAVTDLTKLINEKILTPDNVKEIINEVAPNLTVKEAINAQLLQNMNLDQLKKYILPNTDIVDFMLIENGTKITFSYDPIDNRATDAGYQLFCPHSREEYELARKYLLALGKNGKMGPLGIFYDGDDIPGNWCSGCWHAYHALNSDDMGKLGWKVVDGSPVWWASDRRDISEPNGDYTKYAFLGIWYDDNGYIKHYNDAHSSYSYTTYLTVKRNKN